MMKRILFVDDEPSLLQGLRRSLRSMRHEWDMVFAEGGGKGLIALSENSYDVVVSDMRMPCMNGVQFLSRVREKYPQTIRFALSGYSEEELTLEATRVCHQYLAKPCDPDTLKKKISQTLSFHQSLKNEKVQELLMCTQSIPSLPKLIKRSSKNCRAPSRPLNVLPISFHKTRR